MNRQAESPARLFAVVGCLLYLAACSGCQPDEVASPPASEWDTPATYRQLGTPEQLVAIGGALDDAGSRLVPALEDHVGGAILRIHLAELEQRLEAGDEAGARRALASARRALLMAGGTGPRESVPASAIRLVLDHTQALLDGHDVTLSGAEPEAPAARDSARRGERPASRRED